MQKMLFVWPGAEFSTYDVAKGIQKALVKQGVTLFDYMLFNRIKVYMLGMERLKPEGSDIDIDIAYLHASEAIPYRVAINGCRWVFIVNGMGLHPNSIAAIRRMGVKVACWFTEAPYNLTEELELTKLVDVAFVNERSCLDKYQEAIDKHNKNGMAYYIPHAYDPDTHKENIQEKTIDVFFQGTGFVERQMLFEALDTDNLNMEFGGMWSQVTEPSFLAKSLKYPCLNNQMTVELYHKSKIILNPHRWAVGTYSINPRVFEVAACHEFQIADYREEIHDLFDDTIPTYEHGVPWQLNALIRRYVNDPETRNNMINAAYEKVKYHTFDERAKFIVDKLEQYEKLSYLSAIS